MQFKILKQFGVSVLRSTHLAILISMTILSPVSHALQIKLGSNMHVRVVEGDELVSVGILKAGSVVEIPDQFKVTRPDGRIDGEASFNNWLLKANYSKKDVARKITDPRKDFYYPVRIVSMAKGSTGKNLVNEVRFMALRVLARSSGRMYVRKDSPVYKGRKQDVPLDARGDVEEAAAPAPSQTTAAPSAPNADDNSADDDDDDSAPTQTPPPAPRSNPRANADEDVNNEARSGTNEDCPECSAREEAATTAQTLATAITSRGYSDEARGLQGLVSQFPKTCESFIKPDGSYGPLGQKVLKEMAPWKAFQQDWSSSARAAEACPNYNSFNAAERRHFWVYAFAAMEAEESGCNQNAGADAWLNPNGVAAGGAQIEEDAALRRGRDKAYGGRFCGGGNPYEPNQNIRCAVRMLEDVADNGEGPFSRQNQYWSSYKYPRMYAKALISQYKACGAKPYYTWKQPPVPHRKHHHRKHKHGRR